MATPKTSTLNTKQIRRNYRVSSTNDINRLNEILSDIERRLSATEGVGQDIDKRGRKIINLSRGESASDGIRYDQAFLLENLAEVILGTLNQIIVTDNGDETITLSTPQDIHTGASPTFVGITTTGGRTRSTTRIDHTASPYTVLATDHVIFCDTDGGAIVLNLQAGADGRNLRILNVGSSGNDVSVTPDGTEEIYAGGAGVAFALHDFEDIIIDFETTENWR